MKALNKQMRVFNAYKAKVDALNEELIRKIEALPENPAVKQVSGRCFTMDAKALGTQNWTPFYHRFSEQYKFIRAIIENYDINQIEQIFKEIVTTGNIRLQRSTLTTKDGYEFSGRETYYFHPDVIRMLRDTLM